MPPVLKKKVAGLPMWAWLALVSAGVGVGLILRAKNKGEDETSTSGSPCDPTSPNYNPSECNSEELPEYNYPLPQEKVGGNEFGGGGVGGPSGYQIQPAEESPYPGYEPFIPTQIVPTDSEKGTAAEGGIIVEAPQVTIKNILPKGAGKNNCKGNKPKPKKGYKIVCHGGKWSYEPVKKQKNTHTDKVTGGGPPKKKNNNGPNHNKAKKHKKHHVAVH